MEKIKCSDEKSK